MLELIYAQQQFGRPFVMPPGSPPERIAALRKAFVQALADKDLLAEAAKMNLDVDALSGDRLQADRRAYLCDAGADRGARDQGDGL